jgi:hypothetical protein
VTAMDDFDRGLQASLHPQPGATAVAVSGTATTVGTSWWHTRLCETCGHTFRRGDRVIVDVAGRVSHLDRDLHCADDPEITRAGSADGDGDIRDFTTGVLAAWPPAADIPVVSTDAVPQLLAPPFAGFRRPFCLFCAHTFRPGEMVVVCPCRPRDTRCIQAVHRDPAQGLVCWESWRPDNRIAICPVMLTRTAA